MEVGIDRLVSIPTSSPEKHSDYCYIRIIPLIYAIVLIVLALHKAASFWKLSAGFRGVVLVKVLIKDQVLYFLL